MTFKVIRPLQAFSSAICRTFVQHFTRFQVTACSRGPSAIAGLLVEVLDQTDIHTDGQTDRQTDIQPDKHTACSHADHGSSHPFGRRNNKLTWNNIEVGHIVQMRLSTQTSVFISTGTRCQTLFV